MTRGNKGHVLVHVLITAVIIVVIMASMARMILARYQAYGRHQQSDQGARYTASGVNRLLTVWANTGVECYNPQDTTLGTQYQSTGYTCKRAGVNPTTAPGNADCCCVPADTTNDAAITFASGSTTIAKMCIETPNGTGGYTADTTGGGTCPSIVLHAGSCP